MKSLLVIPLTLTLIVGGFVIAREARAATSQYVNAYVKISVCGDGVGEDPEHCDGADLRGGSCESLGYDSGTWSCMASCDYDASLCELVSPHGGGGGGGGGIITVPVATQVIFTGAAYPYSQVVILKDGAIGTSTIAGADGKFSASIYNLSGGNYNFVFYAVDSNDFRSAPQTISVHITEGVVTTVSGIFIPPTIGADKSEVKQGDEITFFGHSLPLVNVILTVSSTRLITFTTTTNVAGAYVFTRDTSSMATGTYYAWANAIYGKETSANSKIVTFKVGGKTVETKKTCDGKVIKGDLNGDCRVNLVDFSIAAYWYTRTLSSDFALKEQEQLNGDSKISLIDFSIMAYYWTG